MMIALQLLLSMCAFGQVNLDQPVSVGAGDFVFRSSADGQAAYLMPRALMVLNEPRIAEVDGEYRAFFQVGMDAEQFASVSQRVQAVVGAANKPLQLRMLHGWNAQLDAKGSQDTPQRFRARLIPLGDAGNFGASTDYVFAVRKIGPKLGKETQALLAELFASNQAKHLGFVRYEFNAVRGGAPYLGQSLISIFAHQSPVLKFPKTMVMTDVQPRILMDAQAKCWDSIQPGEICLR
jgi:hypothetical protein